MLRTFIRTTYTPERALLVIRAVDLIEKAGYLNMIDSLEAVVAAELQGQSSETRAVLETSLGDSIESIYSLHSITASYDPAKLEEITQHLNFLLYFNTQGGYTPVDIDSEEALYELGDTPEQILDELYEISGHNLIKEPVDWIESVGAALIKRIVKAINENNKQQIDDVTLIQNTAQEDLKKFAALFPESITVKHVKEVRGAVCNINDLFFKYDDQLVRLNPMDLATEVLGFAIISKCPDDITNAAFARNIVEAAAGQGARALEVVGYLNKVILKVGLQ